MNVRIGSVQAFSEIDGQENEELERLLRAAGPPPGIDGGDGGDGGDVDDLAVVREAAHATWRNRYGRGDTGGTKARVTWGYLAAAAVLALAFAAVLRLAFGDSTSVLEADRRSSGSAESVATIDRYEGDVTLRTESTEMSPRTGYRLLPGSELVTGSQPGSEGRIAIRLGDHVDIRVDSGSRLRLVSSQRIELLAGALYFDHLEGPEVPEGRANRPSGVVIAAAGGEIRDVGTQFEVRVGEFGQSFATRVRVREGEVLYSGDEREFRAVSGEELKISEAGDATRGRVSIYGDDWSWVGEMAPAFEIEGAHAREFLDWVARESGWRLEFASREVAATADVAVLHGSIAGLPLAEMPEVVLASCGLEHEVVDGTLLVRSARADAN